MITQRFDGRDVREATSGYPAAIFGAPSQLGPSVLSRGGARAATRTLAIGQDLYRQGERCAHVYLLLEGWAFRHQVLPDGRRQILDFLLPGAILGLSDRAVATHGVEALTECSVALLPRGAILDLLQSDPRSALDLLQELTENETRTFDHLTSLGRRSARERIAALMFELCSRLRALPDGAACDAVTLPLKQAHIADALGLTNEHVCRTLKTMRKDGIMSLRDGQLQVQDVARLAEEAGIEIDAAHEPASALDVDWAPRRSARVHSTPFLTRAA